MSDSPLQSLQRLIGQSVTVQLKDGRLLDGRLVGFDDHMNVVLEAAGEAIGETRRHLGRVIVRGSNIVRLSVPVPGAAARA